MAVSDEIPRSRITLTYRTTVRGEPEEKTLPLRLLPPVSFSNTASVARTGDLDARRIRNLDGTNLDKVMEDMKMSIQFSVPNRIDPENAENIDVNIPITSMRSFTPAEIAKNVPKIKALLLLRKLLLEVQGNLDNRKEFRKLLRSLAQDEVAVQALLEELEGFESFKVPRRSEGGASNGGSASGGGAQPTPTPAE